MVTSKQGPGELWGTMVNVKQGGGLLGSVVSGKQGPVGLWGYMVSGKQRSL